MTQRSAKKIRTLRTASARIRPAALAVLLPLALGACVSNNGRMTGTAQIAPATAPVQVASAAPVITKPVDKGGAPIDMAVALPSSREVALAGLASPVALPTPSPAGRAIAQQAAPAAPTVSEKPSLVAATGRTVVAATGHSVTSAGRAVKSTAVLATDTVTDAVATAGKTAAAVTVASVAKAGEVAEIIRSTARVDDLSRGDTISGSARLDRMIDTAAKENGVPRELAYAVLRVESRFNPRAIGGGAYGLSQIKPATARGLGFSGSAQALLDPETNLRWGMKYLAGAWEKGDGDVCRTAMKYKGGHRTTTMSRSASAYCSAVKQHMAAIKRRRGQAEAGDTTLVAAAKPAAGLPGVRTPAISAAGGTPAATTLASVSVSPAARTVVAVLPGKPVLKPASTVAASFSARTPDFDTTPRAAGMAGARGGRVNRTANATGLAFN